MHTSELKERVPVMVDINNPRSRKIAAIRGLLLLEENITNAMGEARVNYEKIYIFCLRVLFLYAFIYKLDQCRKRIINGYMANQSREFCYFWYNNIFLLSFYYQIMLV